MTRAASLPVLRIVRSGCAMVEHRYYCGVPCSRADHDPAERAQLREPPKHRHACHTCGATVGGNPRRSIPTAPIAA